MSVISRSSWGARRPNGFANRPIPVREFWLHHSVTPAPANNTASERAAMRRLEDIGHTSFGGGISYTYVLPPSGRIYEGHSLHRRGAHTGGHNTVSAAFSLMGNYEAGDRVTDAQMNAIARQMVALHRAGKATRHTLNGGHRDTGFATACPGRHAYSLISEINRRANALWAGGKIPSGSRGAHSAPAPKYYQPKGVSMTVKQIQKAAGVTADGYYGDDTKAAVKKLQQSLGFKGKDVDGLFGPATEKAYLASKGKKPAPKPATPKAPKFPLPKGSYFGPKSGPKASVSGYYGDRAELKKWQAQMRKRGWSITADGLYGPATEKVARQFQKDKKLGVDGLIGATTWAAAWEEPVT